MFTNIESSLMYICQFERSSLVVVACNTSMALALGEQDPEEWIGQYVINLFSPCSFAKIRTLISGLSSEGILCRLADQEGKNPSVVVTIADKSIGGRITLLCVPVADYPAQIEILQKEVDESHRNLEELTKFTGLVVQDFRGLLNVISLSLEFIHFEEFIHSSQIYNSLQRIDNITQRMEILLLELSKFSRYDIGDYPQEMIDTNVLVDQLIQEWKIPIYKKVTIQRTTDLPSVQCKRTMIREMFHNLIENAILYSNADVEITIGAQREDDLTTFFVSDNGVGIHPDDIENVFYPLQRADNHQLNPQGTGMGLAHVKKIIQHHNGTIWLTSTINIGTTIWFRIGVV